MRISDWSSDVCSSDLMRDKQQEECDSQWRAGCGCSARIGHHRSPLPAASGNTQRCIITNESDGITIMVISTPIVGLAWKTFTTACMVAVEATRFVPWTSRKRGSSARALDRKRVVEGKGVSVSVDLGGSSNLKKKTRKKQ